MANMLHVSVNNGVARISITKLVNGESAGLYVDMNVADFKGMVGTLPDAPPSSRTSEPYNLTVSDGVEIKEAADDASPVSGE